MSWVESLQKAIDYIEQHLLEEILIEDIAKQANSSPFHFQRTFAILTDMTIGEYIRNRRLTLAAQELSSSDCKIIDIALKYGYDTPEAFTKAFRKQHSITPSEARNNLGKLHSYNRLVIQVSLKGVEPMKYSILQKEAFQIVGVKREFSCKNDEQQQGIPKFWEDVHKDGINDCLFSLNNGEVKGVLGVCLEKEKTNPGMMDYWIATDHVGEVPEGLMSMEIPESTWAVFEVHGAMPDAMPKVWKQIFSEWFPSSGYAYTGTPELEVYSNDNPFSPDYYSEIWIPVKKK